MDVELTALAEAGAAVVVKAMATDAWQATRTGVVALFRHAGRRHRAAVRAQLDANATAVGEAADPDELRRELFGFWVLELANVLRADPASRPLLAQLVGGTGDVQQFTQHNAASETGVVQAVQHGDQHNHRR